MNDARHQAEYSILKQQIRQWGAELGLSQVGFAGTGLETAEQQLQSWLAAGYHGEMEYMARHGSKRSRPAELEPGTLSVISARLDYLPEEHEAMEAALADPQRAYISRYALGRDYHKLLRKRLVRLAARIAEELGPFGYRVFVDSAPVLEKPLAAAAGLGWVGKHSNLLSREGSWFFLGEIYTTLELPPDEPTAGHCGNCSACIDICPTAAIVEPYVVDARRCISYLTIELHGAIPEPLRPLLGNRIYGCDDCQLACPWNRFARLGTEADFQARHALDSAILLDLFSWDEATFLQNCEGSPIRRLGHERWLRNIAVALGNALRSGTADAAIVDGLRSRLEHPSELVREHVLWALHTSS